MAKMKRSFVFIFFVALDSAIGKSNSLSKILKHYETLKLLDMSHRVRRNIDNNVVKQIEFTSFNEKFQLHLSPSNEIFDPGFEGVAVSKDGIEEQVFIDKNRFYQGYDKEHENSDVKAHIENNVITASIVTKNETYLIEPKWHHDQSSSNDEMIIYKLSDMKRNSSNYDKTHNQPMTCGVNSTSNIEGFFSDKKVLQRNRRDINSQDVTERNTCPLILVADYWYFKEIGKSDKAATIHYMLQVVDRVNRIFKQTEWNGVGKNIGFQVRKAMVYTSYTDPGEKPEFNVQRPSWNVDTLLEAFSYENWSKYCLAHLFTYQDFDRGVIGLAYVASPSTGQVGGICTNTYRGSNGFRYLNCGLSSSLNWGRRLLTLEADLVTAHELGHNFGSSHDPASCQKTTKEGGNYVMYATSVSGELRNNKVFSECSREAIGKVLSAKRRVCFKNQQNAYCGNSKVEKGEECDVGIDKEDQCCNKYCKLKSTAYQCSDANHVCCKNCKIASTSKKCREKFELECNGDTFCDGESKTCPNTSLPLHGNNCGFKRGQCNNGKCEPICEYENKISCACDNPCKICCQNSTNALCEPLRNINENDGIPCKLGAQQGQCIEGKCEKSQQNVEDEFSSLLNNFTFSKFARFMENNIVGTILVFSLMIWIPASCTVYFIDKRNEKVEEEMKQWLHHKNKDFTIDSAKFKMLFKGKSGGTNSNVGRVRTQYHISS